MELQSTIQRLLNRLVEEGKERGIQVAAYHHSSLIVNAWAGVADQGTGTPVREDTLFPVFSTTKGIAATLIHLLAERGRVGYDEPVSKYWPEFGARGKDRITVRQALNHSAGIPQMPYPLTSEELHDWDTMCAKVAGLEPLWEPGTRIQYHAVTYGWIVGEICRRIDGRPFQQMMEEEICRPLGIEAMYVGIPDEVECRVATLEEYNLDPPPPDDGTREVARAMLPLHEWMNRPAARRACLPASNGIMNALAIARHYAALLPGGVAGIELLPPERVRLATEPQKPERPVDENYEKTRGLGYVTDAFGSFGHGGYGGSVGTAEREFNLAFGITRNLFSKEAGNPAIIETIREYVKVLATA